MTNIVVEINEWMNDNWSDLEIIAKKITKNNPSWEELLHIVIEDFLQKKNLQEILDSGDGNGARFYIVRMMLNQYRSGSSYFHKKNRDLLISFNEELQKYDSNYVFGIEDNTDMEYFLAMQELDKMPWYDRMLFKILVDEGHSISSLSKATGIPRTSISLTINRVRK